MKNMPSRFNWDILYRRLSGERSAGLQRAWEACVRQSPEYEQLFQELYPHFQQADHSETVDVYGALNRLRNIHQPAAVIPSKEKGPIFGRWPRLWLAAALVVLLWGTVWLTTQVRVKNNQPVAWKETVAAPGKTMSIRFNDGTKVRLAPGSRLRYPETFERKNRKVLLQGKAFFSVASDSSRPFFVHSGPVVTKVTGTSFEVDSDTVSGKHRVSLLEGAVEMMQHNEPLTRLRPGQSFQMDTIAREWKVYALAEGEAAALRNGGLVFRNETLARIAGILEKQFGEKISISHKNIAQTRFTAVFGYADLHQILQVLEAGGKIRVVRKSNQIVFSPKK